MRPGWDIPTNALTVTLIFTALLSLVIIGSPIAFTIITSVSQTGLISSYFIAIGCMAHKRIRGETFPSSRFTLGRFGLLVNLIALAFLSLVFVMIFFPFAPDPTPKTMNWSVFIFASVIGFAFIYYHFRGRYTYKGHVTYVRKDI